MAEALEDSDASSFSSADSSMFDDFYCEEIVEEDGQSELILMRRSQSAPKSSVSILIASYMFAFIIKHFIQSRKNVIDEMLGGLGYTEFFLACTESTRTEEVIRRSPKGKKVSTILEQLGKIKKTLIADVSILLVTRITACIAQGNGRKLPSAQQAVIWSSFHQLRASPEIQEAWSAFVKHIPELCQPDANLTLQILLDRLLKKMIHNRAEAVKKKHVVKPGNLTPKEANAVRYMAGFVAVKLLKSIRSHQRISYYSINVNCLFGC